MGKLKLREVKKKRTQGYRANSWYSQDKTHGWTKPTRNPQEGAEAHMHRRTMAHSRSRLYRCFLHAEHSTKHCTGFSLAL